MFTTLESESDLTICAADGMHCAATMSTFRRQLRSSPEQACVRMEDFICQQGRSIIYLFLDLSEKH